MLPENYRSGSPEDWLRYARSDLEIAHVEPSATILAMILKKERNRLKI